MLSDNKVDEIVELASKLIYCPEIHSFDRELYFILEKDLKSLGSAILRNSKFPSTIRLQLISSSAEDLEGWCLALCRLYRPASLGYQS